MKATLGKNELVLIKRIFNTYQINDLIYFKYPTSDSIIRNTYTIQRLIGLPNDTVEIREKSVYINNKLTADPASTKHNYFVKANVKLDSAFMYTSNLLEGGEISNDLDYSFSLTKEETKKLKKEYTKIKSVVYKIEQKGAMDETVFPNNSKYAWNRDYFGKIWIPKKESNIKLDTTNISLYLKIIQEYEGNSVHIIKDSIFINNEYTTNYLFKYNYYFALGDNRDNANDSRIFGFLPESFIKGVVIKHFKP